MNCSLFKLGYIHLHFDLLVDLWLVFVQWINLIVTFDRCKLASWKKKKALITWLWLYKINNKRNKEVSLGVSVCDFLPSKPRTELTEFYWQQS